MCMRGLPFAEPLDFITFLRPRVTTNSAIGKRGKPDWPTSHKARIEHLRNWPKDHKRVQCLRLPSLTPNELR